MEGSKKILSIVMATIMVLSVFAGLAVIPASAYTSATIQNDTIVMGQKIYISLSGTNESITVKAVGISGDAEGQVVILYQGDPGSGVTTLEVPTKDVITKSGEYRVNVTNSTATLASKVVSVSEPVLTAKLNDVDTGKTDVSSFVEGHTVYINGTSNAGVEYVKVLDSNGIVKFYATSVNTTTGIGYSVLADDQGRKLSDLGTGTYTLEVKDKVGTKLTKTFTVVEAELSINVPATVVLGNKLTIRGSSTEYGANVKITITGPVGTVIYNPATTVQSNGIFEFKWRAGNQNQSNSLAYDFPSGVTLTGVYKIKVEVGSKSQTAYVEVVSPEVTVNVPSEVVVSKSFDITGTSNREENTKINVTIKYSNGTIVSGYDNKQVSVKSDGTWKLESVSLPVEDTYKITIVQDPGYSALKKTVTVETEAKKPTVTVSAPSEVAYNNKVEITGSITPNIGAGAQVNITIKSKSTSWNETVPVYTDADGKFSYKWDTNVAGVKDKEDTYEITAKLIGYGNPEDKVTVKLVDPEIRIVDAPTVGVIGKTIEIKVWYDQPDGAVVKLYVNDEYKASATVDDKEATLKWNTSGYFEDTYTIKVVGWNVTGGVEFSNIYDITTIELTEQSMVLVVQDSVVSGEKATVEAYTQVASSAVSLKISGNNIPTLTVTGTSKSTKETSGDYAGWYKVEWNTVTKDSKTYFEGGDKGKWVTSAYDKLNSDETKILHLAAGTYTFELLDKSTGNKVTDEITVVSPTLELTSPEDGKAFAIGDDIVIKGTTNKEDGTKIYIYITSADGNYDQELTATVADGAFEKTWKTSGRAAGEYTIKAVYKWSSWAGKSSSVNASDDVIDQVTIELKPAVADIQVMSVDVSPASVKVGETATVTAVVKNLGVAEGTKTITLSVNGVATMQEEVTLAPGESTTLTFEITKTQAGTYTIDVDGVSKTLTVKEEVKPTATTPAPTTPTPTPKQPGFEAVFAIVGLLAVAYLVLRQRKE
jgi:PGF-CTERM protein